MESSVDVYELIEDDASFRVKLREEFLKALGKAISGRTTQDQYAAKLGVNENNFKSYFRNVCRSNMPLKLVLRIAREFGFEKEQVFNAIEWFTLEGSKAKTWIPRFITIDETFVDGFALYIAEGDTGFHGKTRSVKLGLASSDGPVIKFYVNWLLHYWNQKLNELNKYVYVPPQADKEKVKMEFAALLGASFEEIRVYDSDTVTMPKYSVAEGRILLKKLFWFLFPIVKQAALNDEKLAAAYLRGLMAGEGTVHLKGYLKYVRIEMRNEAEIKFCAKLLDMLNIVYTMKARPQREGMWWIYIGHGEDNLRRYAEFVGFGCNVERQDLLVKALASYKQKQFVHGDAERIYLDAVENLSREGKLPTSFLVAKLLNRDQTTASHTLQEIYERGLLRREKIDWRTYAYYAPASNPSSAVAPAASATTALV